MPSLITIFLEASKQGVAFLNTNGSIEFTSTEFFSIWYQASEALRYSNPEAYKKQMKIIRDLLNERA